MNDMIEKLLEDLEAERRFAVEIGEPKMALGIAQAIRLVRSLGEVSKPEQLNKVSE